jgi:flap endonuclease-1
LIIAKAFPSPRSPPICLTANLTLHGVLSKNQQQLAAEEGRLWEEILESTTTPESTQICESLTKKSGVMAASYERRSTPATSQTFEESKEILHAMGVPCLETKGPFEAEALASALVLNGMADYVASEDTVHAISD